MSFGMSRDEYWNGDINTAYDYFEAAQLREKRFNRHAWWQGYYFYEAIAVVVSNALSSKGEKLDYPSKPHGEEETESEKEQQEAQETLQAELYMQQLCEVGKNWGKDK